MENRMRTASGNAHKISSTLAVLFCACLDAMRWSICVIIRNKQLLLDDDEAPTNYGYYSSDSHVQIAAGAGKLLFFAWPGPL